MEKVNDYILLVQNLMPINLCKELIIESSKPEFKWNQHSWYDYGKDNLSSRPTKELEVVSATHEQSQKVEKYLSKALHEYQKKYQTQREVAGMFIKHFSHIRFNRYSVGTKMREHYDHIQSLFDGKLKGIPILSIVGLLNDNYEGGEFMIRENEVKLTRGDILIFPSNFMYPHKVKDITKGMRYSFVSWAF
jgi:predicted 2-oxoglutarate/Fe(II)-dependent dioxygenase YbiX